MHIKKVAIAAGICLGLGLSMGSVAQAADSDFNPKISFHGFLSATGFHQSQNFSYSNGQQAEVPVPGSNSDHSLTGGDMRNTRFILGVSNIKITDGWDALVHISMDFHGGFNGTGPFAGQQETPRARQLYVRLDHPDTGTAIIIGKQLTLTFPAESVPLSYTHIAFPIGFGVGEIGWRYPGVVVEQDLNQAGSDGIQWRLDAGVFQNNWNGPASTTNFQTAGNVGFKPQIEVRLHAKKGDWLGYLTGHYAKFNLEGVNNLPVTAPKKSFSSNAVVIGTAWNPGNWSVRASAYKGKALGNQLGSIIQFGDIKEKGGTGQLGYKFTKRLGAYVTYSTVRPDKSDVEKWVGYGANGSVRGDIAAADLLYTVGHLGLGLEYMHGKVYQKVSPLAPEVRTGGNQVSVSALLRF